MFSKRNPIWRLGHFLNEEAHIMVEDRRFWTGFFMGITIVLLLKWVLT